MYLYFLYRSMSHVLHYIVVRAENAEEAGNYVESQIFEWGGENNWRSIGGIASENGKDDIDCYDKGYSLKYVNTYNGDIYFEKCVSHINEEFFPYLQDTIEKTKDYFRNKVKELEDKLETLDIESNSCSENQFILYYIKEQCKDLYEWIARYKQIEDNISTDIGEYRPWGFDEPGVTNMIEPYDDGQRYIIMLDMHC